MASPKLLKVTQYKFVSYTPILDFAVKKIQIAAMLTEGIQPNFKAPIPLPTQVFRMTLNKSPFTDKKAREQWERRTHYRLISVEGEAELVDRFTKYVENHIPAGVRFSRIEHVFPKLSDFYTPPPNHQLLKFNEKFSSSLRDGSAQFRTEPNPFIPLQNLERKTKFVPPKQDTWTNDPLPEHILKLADEPLSFPTLPKPYEFRQPLKELLTNQAELKSKPKFQPAAKTPKKEETIEPFDPLGALKAKHQKTQQDTTQVQKENQDQQEQPKTESKPLSQSQPTNTTNKKTKVR